jgi:hypothetical protein
MLPFRHLHGHRHFARTGVTSHETYVSAEQPTPQAQARIPIPHAYARRPGDGEASPQQGPSRTLCLSGKSSSRFVLQHDSHRSTGREYAVHEVAFWFSRTREIRASPRWAL